MGTFNAKLSIICVLIGSLILMPFTTEDIAAEQKAYTPFDKVLIRIFSPDSNEQPNAIDTIRVLVSSSSMQREFTFRETDLNTGIFEKEIQLSPDLSRFPGDIETKRNDGLSATFRIDSQTVVTQSVFVTYHVARASFDKTSYGLGDEAVITVIDPDMNRNPATIDTLRVRVWSDSDVGGLMVTLRETGARTGVFQETITFTTDEASVGNRLRVSNGDTIVLKYTDNTLPSPAALSADGIHTVQVEEIFAMSRIDNTLALQQSISSEITLLNLYGEIVTEVSESEELTIRSELENNSNAQQSFVYGIHITNREGEIVLQTWLQLKLMPRESFTTVQAWSASAVGQYTIETFLKEDMSDTIVIPIKDATIIVS